MAISEADLLSNTRTWMSRHWRNPHCPICGKQSFGVGPIIAPPLIEDGGVSLGGATVPLVLITCGDCGYSFTINGTKAGVL